MGVEETISVYMGGMVCFVTCVIWQTKQEEEGKECGYV